MTHVMIDTETLGKKAGCKILSIGACTFDPRGEGSGQTFYRNIDPVDCAMYGLTEDPDTVKWWSEQSQEARDHLLTDRISLRGAMFSFYCWFELVGGEQVWAQGAAFDMPITEHALNVCDIDTPWKFWNVRDTRTAYDLCGFDPRSVKREGTYHNALDDCKHQVACVQAALKNGF